MPATLSEADRNEAAQIVALFSVLIHAWRTNDFREAARVSEELEELGVTVRIPRRRQKGKKGDHAS